MVVYSERGLQRLIKVEFVRFCIVGGGGFIVNASLLALLLGPAGLPVFWAQLLSAEVALFHNFILHDKWTYKAHQVQKTLPRLLVEFHLTTWPAILGSTLIVSAGVRWFHLHALVALMVSSVVALMWNFVWSKFVVWRNVDTKSLPVKEAA